jgi:hypothetical protein
MKTPEKEGARKKSKQVPFTILDEMVDDMAGQNAEILERFKKAEQMRKKAAKAKQPSTRAKRH